MTPIERAAEPAHDAYMHTACTNDHHVVWPAIAHAVFDSIDTNQLAGVIYRVLDPQYGSFNMPTDAARAVKNWLTGKDQQ